MGCGGSRADMIIEPRYHESWTRETESTWLTNTDIETPLPTTTGKALEPGKEKRMMVTTGTQCGKQPLVSSGSTHQRRARRTCLDPGLSQSTRDSRRRASKEVTAPSKDDQQPISSLGAGCGGEVTPSQSCDDDR